MSTEIPDEPESQWSTASSVESKEPDLFALSVVRQWYLRESKIVDA